MGTHSRQPAKKDPVRLYAGLGTVAFLLGVSVFGYVQPKQPGYKIGEVRTDISNPTAVESVIDKARLDAERDAHEGAFTVNASFNPFFVGPDYEYSRQYREWMSEFERRLNLMGAVVEWRENDGSMCCSGCEPSATAEIDLTATYQRAYINASEWYFEREYLPSKKTSRADILDEAKAAVGFEGHSMIG